MESGFAGYFREFRCDRNQGWLDMHLPKVEGDQTVIFWPFTQELEYGLGIFLVVSRTGYQVTCFVLGVSRKL